MERKRCRDFREDGEGKREKGENNIEKREGNREN